MLITTVLNGLDLYFNPCSGKVEDVTGRRHLVCVPDISIMSVVEDLRRSIKTTGISRSRGVKESEI